jgi:predicted methyltransferase
LRSTASLACSIIEADCVEAMRDMDEASVDDPLLHPPRVWKP